MTINNELIWTFHVYETFIIKLIRFSFERKAKDRQNKQKFLQYFNLGNVNILQVIL